MLVEKINFLKVLTLVFVLSFIAACEEKDIAQSNVIQEKIDNFVIYLLERNEEYLVKEFLESSPSFSFNGKLTEDVANFLYKTDSKSGKKSVLDLVAKDNFKTKIIWQKDNVFTVIVVKENKYNKLNELRFLQEEWMKQYFACEFVLKGESILLYQNICFAETGGPFPVEYDI